MLETAREKASREKHEAKAEELTNVLVNLFADISEVNREAKEISYFDTRSLTYREMLIMIGEMRTARKHLQNARNRAKDARVVPLEFT